jgi:hypothetical protein
MKWIKKFEGYLNDPMYQSISYLDFQSIIGIVHHHTWGWSGPTNNYLDKDKEFRLKTLEKEFNKLQSIIDLTGHPKPPNKYSIRMGEVMWKYRRHSYSPYRYREMGDRYYIDIRKGYWIRIFGMEDDWYYVFMNGGDIPRDSDPECYKCDQWEGLVQLLKDKGIL